MRRNEIVKEKYNKLINDIRKEKNTVSLNLIYEDLKQNKNNLYDNDLIPFQFSNDLIWLLVNNLIDINIQVEIFKLYINSFFLFECKPENLNKLRILETIFNYSSFFYKNTSITNDQLDFMKKYFEKYYPKTEKPQYEIGEIVDVFIKESYGNNENIYNWIYGKVKKIEKNFVIIYDYYDNTKEIKFDIDSYELQKKNTFTSEEEMNWRNNLQKGMKIDFLNEKKNWVEAEIVEKTKSDSVVLTEIGGNEKYTKQILSPFIKPLLTFSFPFEKNEINEFFNKFNYCFPIPNNTSKNKNYLLPVDNLQYYSFVYYDLLNYFLNKLFSENILEDTTKEIAIEYIFKILELIFNNLKFINQIFFANYFKDIIFPRIKDKLIKISLNKKKNISKIMIDRLLNISEKMIKLSCNSIQEYKIMSIFIISFGFNCFKISENLEKRILGLNAILTIIEKLKIYKENEIFLIIGPKIYQNLFGENEEDLLDLLFNKTDIHEQLLLKGAEIITNLATLNLLDDKEIIKLYNFALSYQKETKIVNEIYSILKKISQEISIKQKEILINKIISLPMDKIRENDITLMINIIQHLTNNQDNKQILQKVLDYIYNFITNNILEGKSLLYDFTNAIKTFQRDDMIYFYDYFMRKIINELLEQKNGEKIDFYYRFFFANNNFF